MKTMIFIVGLVVFGTTANAQIFFDLESKQPPSELNDIYMEELTDKDGNMMGALIWAPPGFVKDRMGAPVKEQLFVVSGSAKITFGDDEKVVKKGSWIIIPASTPHRIEVLGEESWKFLAIQEQ